MPSTGFRHWFYTDRENRRLLVFSSVAALLLFAWLKIDCPYPNFIPDSYSYLQAAYFNDFIHIRPIGYSKFLRFFSSFSRSHLALVLTQYLLLQAAIVYFFLTIRYLLQPGKWTLRILLACTIVNPLLLKLANFITSDALFTVLSLIWFSQLLRLLVYPDRRLLLTHSFVLLMTFTVRYNALFYPVLSILVIFNAPLRFRTRFVFTGLILFLLGVFISRTQYEYRQKTGSRQFSAFGGWQLAINALYGYAHEPLDSIQMLPLPLQALHREVNRQMDSLNQISSRPDSYLGIYYLSDWHSPLNMYLREDSSRPQLKGHVNRWLLMGELYGQYGRYIIQHHPKAYARYFLIPNFRNYCLPPAEFMAYYDLGNKTLPPIAVNWFRLPDHTVYTYQSDSRLPIIDEMPIVFTIAQLVFLMSFLALWITGSFRRLSRSIQKIFIAMLLFWCCNFFFSVTASVIVLRYQVFPMIIFYTFGTQLTIFLYQTTRQYVISKPAPKTTI